MQFKIIGGDFQGIVFVKHTTLWTGPHAKYFTGLEILGAGKVYAASDIKRVKVLSEQESMAGAGAAALAGGVLLGPIGAIAGGLGARKSTAVYGVEFNDGKKVILKREGPETKSHKVFTNYVEENCLLDIAF